MDQPHLTQKEKTTIRSALLTGASPQEIADDLGIHVRLIEPMVFGYP